MIRRCGLTVLRWLDRLFGEPCMYCKTRTCATIGWGSVFRGVHVPLCRECRVREGAGSK